MISSFPKIPGWENDIALEFDEVSRDLRVVWTPLSFKCPGCGGDHVFVKDASVRGNLREVEDSLWDVGGWWHRRCWIIGQKAERVIQEILKR